MTIYALGGVSGSGKTYMRNNHPALCTMKALDIADFYQQYGPDLHWSQAQQLFMQTLQAELQRDPNEHIVLEAFFGPTADHRQAVIRLANHFGVPVVWHWSWAPRQTCLARIQADPNQDQNRFNARWKFAAEAEEYLFQNIPYS
mmetsp:Transcript_24032/g.41345  ORF Transcript_24032/g.41345 Transcript_24032/m.41345 type:complete len:144 (+) Transcript_24032:69-500(+)|eukprot:CAMPEP_0196651434 /NCGR_PEP_ID=MMETSP1086-20130531/389_1 /TAXON_ID=77921 /ORGANISM="Cyanoptyche  gloeocystis , Strain SAG4.97" /LENGTH=143 /DNA_ID=CAMNT_0041981429 /DNA_START=53 /DNA_END=484 /DNA_ORIENTATION=+